jgi:hypothetical protein
VQNQNQGMGFHGSGYEWRMWTSDLKDAYKLSKVPIFCDCASRFDFLSRSALLEADAHSIAKLKLKLTVTYWQKATVVILKLRNHGNQDDGIRIL